MAPTVKEAEERVIQLCTEFQQGISRKIIQNDMPTLEINVLVSLLNGLLGNNKIDLVVKGEELIYRLKDPGTAGNKLLGADPEEQIVFKIIEESGCKGIWAKDIRIKCNLHQNTVVKVIKKLEGKKMVKSFTSVGQPKKMRYMLYELEPDRSLTGGAWYSDKNFDTEFVDVLTQQCYRYMEQQKPKVQLLSGDPLALQNASYVSSKDVLKYITDLNITRVNLQLQEIESILDALVYDGKAQRDINGDGSKSYMAVTSFYGIPALMKVPCGFCPLINACGDTGDITPAKCIYMQDWLEL